MRDFSTIRIVMQKDYVTAKERLSIPSAYKKFKFRFYLKSLFTINKGVVA